MKTITTYWPEGRPESMEYPEVPVFEILEQTAARVPHRRAIVFGGMEMTFGELKDLSDRFAAALTARGVTKGDRVAIHMPNCPQFAVAYYGILKCGAVFTPVSPLYTARELGHQIRDAGARILLSLDLIYSDEIRETVADSEVETVITTSLADCYNPVTRPTKLIGKLPVPDTLDFADLLAQYDPASPAVSIDPRNDLAHLAYTGGTTGPSKGCMITHYNVVTNVLQVSHWGAGGRFVIAEGKFERELPNGYEPRDFEIPRDKGRAICVVPWFHAMGAIGYLNLPVYGGVTQVVFPRLDEEQFLNAIDEYRPTSLGGAPQLFIPLMNHPRLKEIDLSSIVNVASGSAPLPLEIIDRIRAAISDGIIIEAYGMTECTMMATANPPSRTDFKAGTVGLPVFDTEIKIIDSDGNELEVGEEGEICIKGPQVARGYWNRPEETANTFRDGWIHSGDVGKIDEDGYLTIVDRIKDMVIYKGYNVYPRELEEVLFEHPDIIDAAVIGKPDAAGGEIPVAFIRKAEEATLSEQEVMDFAAQRLAPYKKIRQIVFVAELPRSGAGKVLKTELKKQI